MAKKEKSLMRQLIDERGIKDVAGVQGAGEGTDRRPDTALHHPPHSQFHAICLLQGR